MQLKTVVVKIMNTKRHKERLNCFVTYSIKDRQLTEIDFQKKVRESGKGVINFIVYFPVKHTKTKDITENIPKN